MLLLVNRSGRVPSIITVRGELTASILPKSWLYLQIVQQMLWRSAPAVDLAHSDRIVDFYLRRALGMHALQVLEDQLLLHRILLLLGKHCRQVFVAHILKLHLLCALLQYAFAHVMFGRLAHFCNINLRTLA